MFLNIVWLIGSLVLILVGANALTDGASSVARRMGISDLVVGLTVVAFGTSAPELVISIVSAVDGNASLAIGNVVGSNIFNILVIIGITALVRPVVVGRSIMTNEIPMVLLSSLVLLALGNSSWLNESGINEITRVNGILLLVFLLLFIRYTLSTAKNGIDSNIDSPDAKVLSPLRAVIYILIGLAALIWGGDRFVDSASALALDLGVSEAVVGLTIVAAGTSLPELATSVVAALKGRPGLAVGNVIGSNILNVLMVLGVSASIRPLPFGDINNLDLGTLVLASILFLLFGWLFKERTITRIEGGILAAIYIVYIAILIVNL